MAGIVAVTKFCESNTAAFSQYINYIDRDEATRKDALEKFDLFGEYLNYMDDEKKQMEKMDTEKVSKVSALFTRNSDKLSVEEKGELKELFKTAQSRGSLMWQTVISFDNEYLGKLGLYDKEKGCLVDEKRMMGCARKAIDEMLKAENLENAVWTASFHYNTDNIHIHIASVEPTPMRQKRLYRQWEKNEKGEIKMRINSYTGKREKIPLLDRNGNQIVKECYKGTFKQSSIRRLKSVLESELNQDKEDIIQLATLMRGIIKDKQEQKLMENPIFKDQLLEIYMEVRASGTERRYWNYNQKTFSQIKPKIDAVSDFFIQSYHKDDFAKISAQIEKEEAKFKSAYGGKNNYRENKMIDLYTRLGNAILKELQDYDRRQEEHKSVGMQQGGGQKKVPAGVEDGLKDIKYYRLGIARNVRRLVRRLRRSLERNYTSWRNMADYEKLQRDIEKRGEELQ